MEVFTYNIHAFKTSVKVCRSELDTLFSFIYRLIIMCVYNYHNYNHDMCVYNYHNYNHDIVCTQLYACVQVQLCV